MKRLTLAVTGALLMVSGPLHAAEVTVPINAISSSGVGGIIGTIVFMDSQMVSEFNPI